MSRRVPTSTGKLKPTPFGRRHKFPPVWAETTFEMEKTMNINNALKKAYEGKPLKELADAPISALQGVSEGDAQKMKEAFGVETIQEFADLKFVRWAQAIVTLSATEE